jgi:alpha-beta hydrolase superfamily lysophospholipase
VVVIPGLTRECHQVAAPVLKRRRPRWPFRIVAALTLTAGCAVVASALLQASFGLTSPPGYEHHPGATHLPSSGSGQDPERDYGLAFDNVSFPTSDGSTLRGWLVPAASGSARTVGVVTVHGRGSDRRDFLRHAPMLHRLGATTLLFDLREHGTSDGAARGMSMGFRESADISAAVRYVKSTGIERVVVLGVSLGAGSAILAAAVDPSIDAVIAESPFSSMQDYIQQLSEQSASGGVLSRLSPRPPFWPELVVGFTAWRVGARDLSSPIQVVDRIAPRPLLLMHGTADYSFVPDHSVRLFDKARMPKELWLAPGAEHTRVYDAFPAEYEERVGAIIHGLQ